MESILNLQDVNTFYGKGHILHGITLEVRAKEIVCLLGRNGVGKTTWAASFPKVLLIDLEKGSGHLDVARVPAEAVSNLAAFRSVLKELKETTHD